MKKAVITGITGQDGALLAAFLLKKNYQVHGITGKGRTSINFRHRYLQIEDQIHFHAIDLMDTQAIGDLLIATEPDEFYHLAAISSVGASFELPIETFEFNTRSTLCILETIRRIDPEIRFYQASSSEMFGEVGTDKLPIVESYLFHPVSPYGISKASAHWLTVNYREAYKLKSCCGILFNHESALRPPNFVIKKIVRTAIEISNGRTDKLRLGNVDIVRDWGYAPNYIEVMWRMLQEDDLDDYLICSGYPLKLWDFVKKVFDYLNLELEPHVETDPKLRRSLDLETIYGDNTKAKQRLEWDYSITPDELVAQLVKDEHDLIAWELQQHV